MIIKVDLAKVSAAESATAKSELAILDLQSIRSIREYLAATIPALKIIEASAIEARRKVK